MVSFLRLDETRNGSYIYHNLYKQVNHHFSTDVFERGTKSILNTLTTEELEFVILELLPRYREKKLSQYRLEYDKVPQNLEFDF
ncbi:hypothetical protein JOD82_002153 [Paenibacillus sp. 1182]|uniref:hypothetical protein n=1 Tax=Paenibacillus sp. 1182 TaxID=2806565 RepID=UPI001AE7D520|nr:hypothetical protein [Paenibacillus sp. 1182]MBP1309133.1 hypothetical protein [Paenibacillus sp. 1182]